MNLYTKRLPDIISDNTWTVIKKLSWPLIITMLFNSLSTMIDTYVAGQVSSVLQSALGFNSQIMMIIFTSAMMIGIGNTALISQNIGAKNYEEAIKIAKQSVMLVFFIGICVVIPFFFFSDDVIKLVGAKDDVILTGYIMLKIVSFGLIQLMLSQILSSIFRAKGDMYPILLTAGIGFLFTVCIDFTLVLGWGGFPKLGITGIAISQVSASTVNMFILFFILKKSDLKEILNPPWKPSLYYFKKILAIGLPAAVQNFIRIMGSMFFFSILAGLKDGTQAIAALSVGLRIESLAFMPLFALTMVTSTVVGQNIGAKQFDRVRKLVREVVFTGLLIIAVMSTFFYFFAYPVCDFFSKDPLVQEYSAEYLQVISFCLPFFAISQIIIGSMQGAGYTIYPMLMTILHMWIIRIPIAYIFIALLNTGPIGAWLAMSISTIIQSIFFVVKFQSPDWMTAKSKDITPK